MKETLHYILTSIVDHPDEVSIEEKSQDQMTIYMVKVHPDDMGKVIGKSGRIIRAIRDLVKMIATKHNTYVDIELVDQKAE